MDLPLAGRGHRIDAGLPCELEIEGLNQISCLKQEPPPDQMAHMAVLPQRLTSLLCQRLKKRQSCELVIVHDTSVLCKRLKKTVVEKNHGDL
jgi:hypothetical protein